MWFCTTSWCRRCKEEPVDCDECDSCLYCCDCDDDTVTSSPEEDVEGDFDKDERGDDPEEDLHGEQTASAHAHVPERSTFVGVRQPLLRGDGNLLSRTRWIRAYRGRA